jgi:HAD superfamily hydrolase (TIGR01509 family)
MTIDAVVFDFDGLILDTEAAEHRATVEVFSRFGCELSEDEYSSIVGSSWDAYTALEERAKVPIPPRAELRAAYDARTRELHAELDILPGVVEWIQEIRERGLKVAIASTSSESWVTGHLDRIGLGHAFEVFSCCGLGEVMPAKPAPDCYVDACKQLGVPPKHALAVEDSINGVLAAKAAGLWCVAVPNPLTRRLDLSAADVQLASLADASLAQVLSRLPS